MSRARDAQQQIAECRRGADTRGAIDPAALRSDFSTALGSVYADARDDLRIEAHFAAPPEQFRPIGIHNVEPGRFASVVPVR